jgi:putative hydrolase of the HAD superfamily
VIQYLFFDLDNTLYSSRTGLENGVTRRMKEFSAEYLGVSPEEAWKQRVDMADKYGTTLEWLMGEKGFTDVEAYFAAIHPADEADSLSPDPELRAFLERLPLPKAILTNSPREHADRILGRLGIGDQFTYIFDVRLCNFTGKPHPDFFNMALESTCTRPETVLFIDDTPRYVNGFLALGGKGLLFDENDHWPDYPHQRIRRLEEIEALVKL